MDGKGKIKLLQIYCQNIEYSVKFNKRLYMPKIMQQGAASIDREDGGERRQ